jgi:hypothetical protein
MEQKQHKKKEEKRDEKKVFMANKFFKSSKSYFNGIMFEIKKKARKNVFPPFSILSFVMMTINKYFIQNIQRVVCYL